MTVAGINSQRLRSLLRKQQGRTLLLDCRPFLCFSASHVHGSLSVSLNTLMVRRARGSPLPLHFIIPDEKAQARLREGRVATVVVLDERTPQRASKGSTAQIVFNTLTTASPRTKIYFLK
eukprot:g20407.t1